MVMDQLEEIVLGLGGIITEHWEDCTVLVTDKVRRTVKFLCALSAGVPIVTPKWLEACHKSGSFLGIMGLHSNGSRCKAIRPQR
jgi:hypothetical protein